MSVEPEHVACFDCLKTTFGFDPMVCEHCGSGNVVQIEYVDGEARLKESHE